MTVIINGDTGISGVNGSAANPAITGTDADTGIHFGSDSATITTGGTERVSVDSTGAATFSGTVKTSKVENANTSNGGVEIDTAGHVQLDGLQMPTDGSLSHRNIIINGGMRVSQRPNINTGQTASAYRACDRFRLLISNAGTWTILQDFGEVPQGFSSSFRIDCTSGGMTSASSVLIIRYVIEARDLQVLDYGTANAQPATLSFWVKSNKTGGATIQLNSQDGSNRSFITTYTINTANTWEYKTISIPADTGGTINDDNGSGLEMDMWLNSGTFYQGSTPASGWAPEVTGARNNTNLGVGNATGDNFYLTGVQLEVGEKATPFEHRSFAEELARCKRYFQKTTNESQNNARTFAIGAFNANRGFGGFPLNETMRTAPAVSYDHLFYEEYSLANSHAISDITNYGDVKDGLVSLDLRTATNVLTSDKVYLLTFGGSTNAALRGFIEFDAEF